MAGLGTPLVNVVPTSDVGQLIDVIVNVWMLVLSGIIISTVYQTSLVIRLQEKLPNSKIHRFLILFVFVPIVLLIVLFCSACFFVFFENWDLKPSLQYVASAACGLGNPLTDEKPVLFQNPSPLGGSRPLRRALSLGQTDQQVHRLAGRYVVALCHGSKPAFLYTAPSPVLYAAPSP